MQPVFRRLNAKRAALAATLHCRVCRRQQALARMQQFRRLNSVALEFTGSVAFRRLNTGLQGCGAKPAHAGTAVFRRLNVGHAVKAAAVHGCPCAGLPVRSLLFRRLNSGVLLTTPGTAFRRLNSGNTWDRTDLSLFRRLNSCLALREIAAILRHIIHPYVQARSIGRSWHVHTHETAALPNLNPAKCGVQCFWAPKGQTMR